MSKLEDKYTRIANNILDAMMKTRFSPTQYRIIHAVWRHTYGYQRKDHEFGLAFLEELTELDPRQLRRDLKSLIDGNVLIVTQQPTNKAPRKIGFNKYVDLWRIDGSVKKVERTELPPQDLFGEDMDTHSREDNSTHSGEGQQHPHIKKDLKKDIKEIINSRFNEFWNYYPKKVGKKDALRHFERLHKDKKFNFDDFILGTMNYVNYCKTAKRFYKDASSYVNQETYKDFLEVPDVQEHQQLPSGNQSKAERNRQLLQEMMGRRKMNKAQTAQLLLLVTAAYRNVELSKEETALWNNMLQDMDFGKAQQNLANHIKTNRYPPTIADIRCEDTNQFVNYDQLRQETQVLLQTREEGFRTAIDCPPHLRTVFLTEGVENDGDI